MIAERVTQLIGKRAGWLCTRQEQQQAEHNKVEVDYSLEDEYFHESSIA